MYQSFIILYLVYLMYLVDVVRHTVPDNVQQIHAQQTSTYEKTRGCQCTLCLTTSTNYTSNNLPHMKNQRLPVQF